MKKSSIVPNIIFIIILVLLMFLYRRFEDKRLREETQDNTETIQNTTRENGSVLGHAAPSI